jgi:hypothetical protein
LHWQAEPEAVAPNAIALYLNEPLTLNDISKSFLEAAGALSEICPVILVFDTIYSRCRVYSLGRLYGIKVENFKIDLASKWLNDAKEHIFVDFNKLGGALPKSVSSVFVADHVGELCKLCSAIDMIP